MKRQKYPLRRLWLVVALFLAFLLVMQIPWSRNHRTNSGVSRSFAPNGDEIRTAEGRVDYLATSNSLASRDLLPADNAAVPLTTEYAARARPIANERVALAGYRLADVLNELFAK